VLVVLVVNVNIWQVCRPDTKLPASYSRGKIRENSETASVVPMFTVSDGLGGCPKRIRIDTSTNMILNGQTMQQFWYDNSSAYLSEADSSLQHMACLQSWQVGPNVTHKGEKWKNCDIVSSLLLLQYPTVLVVFYYNISSTYLLEADSSLQHMACLQSWQVGPNMTHKGEKWKNCDIVSSLLLLQYTAVLVVFY
jgi:hypothetical protein